MAKLPQTWVFEIYSKLWLKFKDSKFSNKQAQDLIKNSNLNQAISRLKNAGWLNMARDKEDSRKSVYLLYNPEKVILNIIQNYKKV